MRLAFGCWELCCTTDHSRFRRGSRRDSNSRCATAAPACTSAPASPPSGH
jgi:hypothetical protein